MPEDADSLPKLSDILDFLKDVADVNEPSWKERALGLLGGVGYNKAGALATASSSAAHGALMWAVIRLAYEPIKYAPAAHPSLWPSAVAYFALGGRIVDGARVDDASVLKAYLMREAVL